MAVHNKVDQQALRRPSGCNQSEQKHSFRAPPLKEMTAGLSLTRVLSAPLDAPRRTRPAGGRLVIRLPGRDALITRSKCKLSSGQMPPSSPLPLPSSVLFRPSKTSLTGQRGCDLHTHVERMAGGVQYPEQCPVEWWMVGWEAECKMSHLCLAGSVI